MSSRHITLFSAFMLALMFFMPVKSYSQVIKPTGKNTEASSQLIYWFDEEVDDTDIQVTNTNDTQGVWIHVQIFRSFDADGNLETTTDKVICDERDFFDFLTPNDTHLYVLDDDPINKNQGEDEINPGEEVNIDLDFNVKGFIIITPVVSEADASAISFQHLIGRSLNDNYYRTNAMGRDAVDFTTGQVVPDGTVLDGVSSGFVVLQPEELIFEFSDEENNSTTDTFDLVGIVFQDSYGSAGLLGYNVLPATANWTSFIFDFKEDPTSCGTRVIECFDDLGLDDTDFTQQNDLLGEDYLCAGFDPPANGNGNTYGWTRIFVSGLGEFVNHLGLIFEENTEGSVWMNTK